MDSGRVAEIERVARDVVRITQAARRLDDSDTEVRARSQAADAVLWAIAAWKANRNPAAASFRARRVRATWGRLLATLEPHPARVTG